MNHLVNFSLLNLDKPSGPTSFNVSEFVRRKLGLTKTSHMGTLDPAVSGVLPITLGRACRLASHFIRHDKDYVGVLETHKNCDLKVLQGLIDENFSGKIMQTPPHKSAVKRVEREREVYSFEFIEAHPDRRHFLFKCSVEGGTYIRKICSDLGERIGGAHMCELRRTRAGIFSEEKIYKLGDFVKAVEEWKKGNEKKLREMIVPAEVAIREVLPSVEIKKVAVKRLMRGSPLFKEDVINQFKIKDFKLELGEIKDDNLRRYNKKIEDVSGVGKDLKDGFFAVFCGKDFVGIYKVVEGWSNKGKSKIFAKAEFVFN